MNLVRGSVGEDNMALEDIVNPIDRGASEPQKAHELALLSASNLMSLQTTVDQLDRQGNTRSQVNCKAEAKIEEKAQRPATRRKYAWFRVEHIRDALRFRSVIDSIASFEAALDFLVGCGMPIVKVDLDKMCNGTLWGWRFAALDFRLAAADGQLVEYYVTFDALMKANDGPCHALYERGRGVRAGDPNVDVQALMEASQLEYEQAWALALNALGMDQPNFERAWSELRARLGR